MNIKRVYTISACMTAAAVILRIVQIACVINPETGFFEKTKFYFSVPLLAAVMIAAAVFFLLLRLWIPQPALEDPVAPFTGGSFYPLLITGTIAILFVLNGIYAVVSCFKYGEKFTMGVVISLILSVLASGFFFLSLTQKSPRKMLQVFSLFPVIWVVVRLIRTFMHYTMMANSSAHLIDILMLTALMLYLLAQCKTICGLPAARGMLVYGLLSVLLLMTSALPKILFSFIPSFAAGNSISFETFLDLFFAIYIMLMLAAVFRSRKKPQKPAGEAEKKAENI